MFFLYQIILTIIILISPAIIGYRILKNKEHRLRYKEKFGFYSKGRIDGKLIWFHGASVGEILSVIPIIKNLENNKKIKKILITSSTTSSASILKKIKFKKTTHIYFPIDEVNLVKRFIKFWKPKIAIFIDSEIWPNMLNNLSKKKYLLF